MQRQSRDGGYYESTEAARLQAYRRLCERLAAPGCRDASRRLAGRRPRMAAMRLRIPVTRSA